MKNKYSTKLNQDNSENSDMCDDVAMSGNKKIHDSNSNHKVNKRNLKFTANKPINGSVNASIRRATKKIPATTNGARPTTSV